MKSSSKDELSIKNSTMNNKSQNKLSLDQSSMKSSSEDELSTKNSTPDWVYSYLNKASGKGSSVNKLPTKNSNLDNNSQKPSSLDKSSRKGSSVDKLSINNSTLDNSVSKTSSLESSSTERSTAMKVYLLSRVYMSRDIKSRIQSLLDKSKKNSTLDNNSTKPSFESWKASNPEAILHCGTSKGN